MNQAHLFMLKTDASRKIAAVDDPAVRDALEAILKLALMYPDSRSGSNLGAF